MSRETLRGEGANRPAADRTGFGNGYVRPRGASANRWPAEPGRLASSRTLLTSSSPKTFAALGVLSTPVLNFLARLFSPISHLLPGHRERPASSSEAS